MFMNMVGGTGWAEGGNLVMVSHMRKAYTVGASAVQKETGIMTQNACVYDTCGTTKVLQKASADNPRTCVAVNISPDVKIDQNQIVTGAYVPPKPKPPCYP